MWWMLAIDRWGAIWPLLGLVICYLIGLALVKSHAHGYKVNDKPKSERRWWDSPWVGSPSRKLGKQHRGYRDEP